MSEEDVAERSAYQAWERVRRGQQTYPLSERAYRAGYVEGWRASERGDAPAVARAVAAERFACILDACDICRDGGRYHVQEPYLNGEQWMHRSTKAGTFAVECDAGRIRSRGTEGR